MAPTATAAAEALLQALGGRPGASAAELADGAGIGRSTANKLLVKLAAEGRVVREAGGRRNGRRRPDRWTLLAPAPAPPAKDPDRPPTTPQPSTPDEVDVGSSAPAAGRLGAGELRRLVLAYLTDHPEQPLSPTAIAKALDRSAGAVANALAVLADQGAVAQTQITPRRYASSHDHSPTAPTTNRPAPSNRRAQLFLASRPVSKAEARHAQPAPGRPATLGGADPGAAGHGRP